MAEFDHVLVTFADPLGGTCRLVAVCDDSQTEPNPEGGTSPLVVAVKVQNGTAKPGQSP